jgi:hypothetical protein
LVGYKNFRMNTEMVDVVTLAVIRQVQFDDGRAGFELQRHMVGQNLNIAEDLAGI